MDILLELILPIFAAYAVFKFVARQRRYDLDPPVKDGNGIVTLSNTTYVCMSGRDMAVFRGKRSEKCHLRNL